MDKLLAAVSAAHKTSQRREEAAAFEASAPRCNVHGCTNAATHLVQYEGNQQAPERICKEHRKVAATLRADLNIKRIVKNVPQKFTNIRRESERNTDIRVQEGLEKAADEGDEAAAGLISAAGITANKGKPRTRHICENCGGMAEHIVHFNANDSDSDYMAPLCPSCTSRVTTSSKGAAALLRGSMKVLNLYQGSGSTRKLDPAVGRKYNAHIESLATTAEPLNIDTGAGVSRRDLDTIHAVDLMRAGSPPTKAERNYFIDRAAEEGSYDPASADEYLELSKSFDTPQAKAIMEDASKDVTKYSGDIVVTPRPSILPKNRAMDLDKRDTDEEDPAARVEVVHNPNASATEAEMGAGVVGVETTGMSANPHSSGQRGFSIEEPPAGPHTQGEPYSLPNQRAASLGEGDTVERRIHAMRQAALALDVSTPLHKAADGSAPHFWGNCPDCRRYRPGIPTLETGLPLESQANIPLNIGSELTMKQSRELHPHFWGVSQQLNQADRLDRDAARRVAPSLPLHPTPKSEASAIVGEHVAAAQVAQIQEHLQKIDEGTVLDENTPFVKNVEAKSRFITPNWSHVRDVTETGAARPSLPQGPSTTSRQTSEGLLLGEDAPTCSSCGASDSTHTFTFKGGDIKHMCSACSSKERQKMYKGRSAAIGVKPYQAEVSTPVASPPSPVLRAISRSAIFGSSIE